MASDALTSLSSNALPAGLSPPLEALWWLRKGKLSLGPEWEKAHQLCQSGEGDRAYDLVHALTHWIEGDMSNADCWYRRVGGNRAATLQQEWERIASLLSASLRKNP
jgi:hypothetical protein